MFNDKKKLIITLIIICYLLIISNYYKKQISYLKILNERFTFALKSKTHDDDDEV